MVRVEKKLAQNEKVKGQQAKLDHGRMLVNVG